MAEYSKYNIVYRMQRWMDSVPGQTFLNYAYSWGASIVILGALFKLTHLPGANIMLFVGMGTEVIVFFISAFDRPFDKTAEGRDIPTHITEEYLESGETTASANTSASVGTTAVSGAPQVVVVGSGKPYNAPADANGETLSTQASQIAESLSSENGASAPTASTVSAPQPNFVPQMSQEEAEALNEAQGNYVDELKNLVETLKKVNEQSSRLTRDSEEMENLNRTLTGISKIYELQLKGASQQVGTIESINAQTQQMAQQIQQLNAIYARMIEAMTVNMRAATNNNA
ncbi:MAG: gliding motility protein GldL [Prevotella sp.]|jgi:gliding motility-associated protein GldL|nr:gliding motility protein GldL [Prevotella sp.]